MQHKNIFYTSSLLPGAVTGIVQYHWDNIHNAVYEELIEETDYFGNKSNERVYLDLRVSAGYIGMKRFKSNSVCYTKNAAPKTLD